MAESPTARITKLEQELAVLEECFDAFKQQVERYDVPALAQRMAVFESQLKDLRDSR